MLSLNEVLSAMFSAFNQNHVAPGVILLGVSTVAMTSTDNEEGDGRNGAAGCHHQPEDAHGGSMKTQLSDFLNCPGQISEAASNKGSEHARRSPHTTRIALWCFRVTAGIKTNVHGRAGDKKTFMKSLEQRIPMLSCSVASVASGSSF